MPNIQEATSNQWLHCLQHTHKKLELDSIPLQSKNKCNKESVGNNQCNQSVVLWSSNNLGQLSPR